MARDSLYPVSVKAGKPILECYLQDGKSYH